ncbi:hypothetical protein ACWDYJ_30220 [Streptomyces sp. NPDC003042]
MSVDQLLHATYAGDGFRFYDYAGTFFEYLWRDRPSELQAMYRYLRANDVTGFDAWRNRLGADAAVQHGYDTFLDEQIAKVADLFVPHTAYQPTGTLTHDSAAQVQSALAAAAGAPPQCSDTGDTGTNRRFVCTGRLTATLTSAADPDLVFKEMSAAVDRQLIERALGSGTNFQDMNCWFGPTAIAGTSGTSPYACEGPLRG